MNLRMNLFTFIFLFNYINFSFYTQKMNDDEFLFEVCFIVT